MRVQTLGAALSTEPHLPSSESVLCMLKGEPGGFGKVVASTLLRALLVAPGVWFGGARTFKSVAVGSLVASSSITAFLFVWYAMHRAPESAVQPLPAEGPQAAAQPSISGWRR